MQGIDNLVFASDPSPPAAMDYDYVESGLLAKRRSRCSAGSGTASGKRCAPGQADEGICHAPAAGLRDPLTDAVRAPRSSRRLNKTVRAVCRLWWRGPMRAGELN